MGRETPEDLKGATVPTGANHRPAPKTVAALLFFLLRNRLTAPGRIMIVRKYIWNIFKYISIWNVIFETWAVNIVPFVNFNNWNIIYHNRIAQESTTHSGVHVLGKLYQSGCWWKQISLQAIFEPWTWRMNNNITTNPGFNMLYFFFTFIITNSSTHCEMKLILQRDSRDSDALRNYWGGELRFLMVATATNGRERTQL